MGEAGGLRCSFLTGMTCLPWNLSKVVPVHPLWVANAAEFARGTVGRLEDQSIPCRILCPCQPWN